MLFSRKSHNYRDNTVLAEILIAIVLVLTLIACIIYSDKARVQASAEIIEESMEVTESAIKDFKLGDKEISRDEHIELLTEANAVFHNYDNMYELSSVTYTYTVYYTVAYVDIEELYEKRNAEIEAEVIEATNKIQAVWDSYGYDFDISLLIVSRDNPELIYFSVINGEVDFTMYDSQRIY